MKRFILASGLLTALAFVAVAAPSAPRAAKPATQASAACSPLCGPGACSMQGSAAAAGTVHSAAVATNGNACPVSDPSLCQASCRPTQAGVAARPAAKRTATVVASR
jgi:hypothetical protein